MITDIEKLEIEELAKGNTPKRSNSIEALKIVQRNHGWISDENVKAVAEIFDMTAEELDGVATFYSHLFRKVVGRHVILICENVSCWIMGFEKILAHLIDRLGIHLGETTADGRFTLLPVACLGACDRAPAMMVDDELVGDLTPEKIDEILERIL